MSAQRGAPHDLHPAAVSPLTIPDQSDISSDFDSVDASPLPMLMADSAFAAVRTDEKDREDDDLDDVQGVDMLRQPSTVHRSLLQEPSSAPARDAKSDTKEDEGAAIRTEDVAVAVRSSRSRYRVSSVDKAIRNLLYLLKPTSPVLDSQIYLTVGAITTSFLFAAFSIVFRLEIYDITRMNSGLLFGSIGSLVMCSFIIVMYWRTKWYRRHMHILLFNLALCEFGLALSFLLEPAWRLVDAGINDNYYNCTWLSTLREYLIMYSTVWSTCMAIDLYYLMTDPFTSPRLNRRKYRVLSQLFASVAAITMAQFNAFNAPVAVGNFCWVGAKREAQNSSNLDGNTGIWLFIIAPVAISMGINIYVTFISYNRFRDGLAASLKNRHVLLREGFLTTITFIVYSALLWGVYGGYWLASSSSIQSEILSVLFAFLLSYRGSVAFILWCLYKKPSTGDETPSADDEEGEDAVRPQMNLTLLEEVVQFTTEGIAQAVRIHTNEAISTSSRTFTLRAPSSRVSRWGEIKFTDYHPDLFARLRECFGIDNDAFLSSLARCTTPKVSEGASGSFMFYSKDRSFIVKSLTTGESAFLHSFLERYVAYMTSHQDTFLTRFLGSYCILFYGQRTHFVVMENVFDVQHGISIHQRYDIKGSWVDRNATKIKYGAETTCRHCNLAFRCGVGRNVCPNRAGAHEPNVVLKDMDLTTKLRFGPVEGKRLLKQLKRDSDFLCDQGIMDYSLLLGVIEVSYQVNQQNILTRDGSVFLDKLVTETSDVPGRVKQSAQCLRTSEVVIGPGFYYIGIIDILQTWNMSKRIERFMKTVLFRKDPDGISAMPPKAYRTRFHKKLDEIIHLGHNVVATPKNSSHYSHFSRNNSLQRMTAIALRGVPSFRLDAERKETETEEDSGLTGNIRSSH
ncbi:hypothetical protein Poli38472_013114 [Pythium oligandrum]|uniref:PIPK domain-containing protein n=1 Tax=Pythium oligandrum TaxID=41045 RepID=A0A8K1C2K9_PYTOL|nr:hypothetical protein Poli38472_013114 [Pythium oligandrum]|eukprot:TMW55223.1 hypothetical protein Poli38472_013114 [Pythium oligandrum]